MKSGAPIEVGHILLNDALVIAVTEGEVYATVLCLLQWSKHTPYATWEYRVDQRGATYNGHYTCTISEAVKDYEERVANHV